MNGLRVAAVVVALLASAGWCLVIALRRVPRSVAAAQRSMRGDPHAPTTPDDWRARLTTGAAADLVASRLGVGLQVIDATPADVVTRVLTSAVVMLTVVGFGVGALIAAGALPGLLLLTPPIAAALAGWTAYRGVVAQIARRRAQLRRAANDFVQLVAIGLTTDQSVEEAIRFALQVGTGDGFDELRREVDAAPLRGVPVWDAVAAVGHRFEVRELGEFAASVERQGLQGVGIGDTVAALAAGMRAKALDELERDADRANANLSGPTIGFVVATIVFLAYPLAQRISDAFGG